MGAGFARIIPKVCGSYKGGATASVCMKKITPALPEKNTAHHPDEDGGEAFKPLTAQEARQWRQRQRPLSLWRALLLQAAVGAVAVLLAWLASGSRAAMWSAAYGALAVVLPAALFARGMARSLRVRAGGGAALAGLFVWEGAKLALTVAMLLAAPRLFGVGLHWLALVAGFVLTLKSYWLALWLQARGGSGVGPVSEPGP